MTTDQERLQDRASIDAHVRAAEMADLRHHWSGAYRLDAFEHQGGSVWTALHRDEDAEFGDHLEAGSAAELREKIRADHAARGAGRG